MPLRDAVEDVELDARDEATTEPLDPWPDFLDDDVDLLPTVDVEDPVFDVEASVLSGPPLRLDEVLLEPFVV